MLSVENPVRFTPVSERYLSLEVNASTPEKVDWNSLFEQKKGHLHSVEICNSGNEPKEVDLRLFMSVKNHLSMNEELAVLIIRKVTLTEKHIDLLCQALSRTRWLQHLTLQECGLLDSSCKIICDSLPSTPTVSTLDLSGNNITAEGAKVIAKMLKREELERGISCWMRSLRGRMIDKEKVLGLSRLTLNDNLISDEGLRDIVECLYDDIWIKAIDMQRCDITNEGAKLVLGLLNINTDISVFDLRGNTKISPQLITTIMKQILRNQKAHLNKGDELWLSTQKVNTEPEPEWKEMKMENEWSHSKLNSECHLRRTQSCYDHSSQRYVGTCLWKRTSVHQFGNKK